MPRVLRDFSESYIGTVYGYNIATRELEVFIPKLMPAIPENRKDILMKTNLGMLSSKFNIKYNDQITLTSTITAKAEDMKTSLPKIGSKVEITFFEGNPTRPMWDTWNSNNDYEVIDEEKYPKSFHLKIGDKEFDVDKDDNIEIILPSGLDVCVISQKDSKHKVLKINSSDTLTNRVNILSRTIGNNEVVEEYTDTQGNLKTRTLEASGLIKSIMDLEKEVKALKEQINEKSS